MRQPLLFALLILASGCATPPPKPPPDAWFFTQGWAETAADGDLFLRGRGAQTYQVPGAYLVNLKIVVVAARRQSGLDPEVALVASEYPNAFASSRGGQPLIALTLPMLDLIGADQDALAAIVGHELAHVYLKHGESRRQRAETASGVSQAVGVVLGMVGFPMGGTVTELGFSVVNSAYSRDEERAADLLGLQWATASGYSACGSARTMRQLKMLSSATSLPFLSSHPGHDERAVRASQMALKTRGETCQPS